MIFVGGKWKFAHFGIYCEPSTNLSQGIPDDFQAVHHSTCILGKFVPISRGVIVYPTYKLDCKCCIVPPSQKKEHTICEPSLGIEVECYLFSGGAISILMSTSFANLGLPRQGAINHTPRIHRRVQLICHCLNAQGLLEFSQASVPYAAYWVYCCCCCSSFCCSMVLASAKKGLKSPPERSSVHALLWFSAGHFLEAPRIWTC